MSYNVGGHAALVAGRYLERIARVIECERPDLVGLQEVHRGTWLARFADQAEILAGLTGLTLSFGKSFDSGKGEFGNALLAAGEVRESVVHPLPGSGEPRTLLAARVAVRGTEVHFLVTHLAAWGRFGSAARAAQVAELDRWLGATAAPFVLVGDLNAPPEAPELAHLMLSELFRRCGGLESTHRMTRQRIDYVFADPGWTTVASRVLRVGPSDHWPVVVELRREA
ncbi:MAG TPA: endonuclease/exonuclease/phosphatase family protein [Thermoanaerobaculia bacterium]|nr:endonuclease/exonuclease/phosphatase family protein [Thermoanaerobaculia bacterium]